MKFRHELKYNVNLCDLTILRMRLKNILPYDKNADDEGMYVIRSLYFDNYMDKALREKNDGVNKREKFRIRYYGNDTEYINLEKKSKINGLCVKEKARLTKEECEKIISGDTLFLAKSDNMLKKEFYAKTNYQILRPKCIVTYSRECFVYPAGNVRITLDTDIKSSYNVHEFLNPGLKSIPVGRNAVLEVKWDEYLPTFIKNALQIRSRKQAAFSKYAASRI